MNLLNWGSVYEWMCLPLFTRWISKWPVVGRRLLAVPKVFSVRDTRARDRGCSRYSMWSEIEGKRSTTDTRAQAALGEIQSKSRNYREGLSKTPTYGATSTCVWSKSRFDYPLSPFRCKENLRRSLLPVLGPEPRSSALRMSASARVAPAEGYSPSNSQTQTRLR